jgi:hypothetical protein
MFALWRHEAGRAGWPALLTPLAVAFVATVLATSMIANRAPHHSVVRLLVAGCEVGLPLATGVGATALVGRDNAVELQLSMPTSYRATWLRRFTVTVAWPALIAAVGTAVLLAAGSWTPLHRGVAALLVWMPPLIWLAALGAVLAVGLRSSAAASGLVASLWLAEQLFAGLFATTPIGRALFLFPATWLPGMPGWWINRTVLLGTAAALLVGMWALLTRPNRLLSEDDQ